MDTRTAKSQTAILNSTFCTSVTNMIIFLAMRSAKTNQQTYKNKKTKLRSDSAKTDRSRFSALNIDLKGRGGVDVLSQFLVKMD